MSYTSTLTITIPNELYGVACSISRALDPDSGGDKSFGPRTLLSEEGVEYIPSFYTTSTPCTSEFYEKADILLNSPEILYQVVSEDYATRWVGMSPPTYEECVAFCNGLVKGN